MTRKVLNLLLIITFLVSCETGKTYKYIEVDEEDGILGGKETKEKNEKSISASSDSAAYVEAYKNFCIAVQVNKNMKQSLGTVYSTPITFKLLNDKGEDISKTILFTDKVKREKEIADQISSMPNTLQDVVDKNKDDKAQEFKASAKIDSVKIKGLLKYFTKKKDEFDKNNKIWYQPQSAPHYTNRNGIYLYFETENGIPMNLRFRFQYYADDWLFFGKVQFAIDGKAYEYIPDKTETDSGDGGMIWEWFDQPLTQSDKDLIYALANAKSAKMKLIGRQYFDTKVISKEQIVSMKQTLDLYTSMGGEY